MFYNLNNSKKMEDLTSMGDTGKTDFKEEVVTTEQQQPTDEQKSVAEEQKTVNDVIVEKEKERELSQDELIAKQREEEANKKIAELYWYRWQDEAPVKEVTKEETKDEVVGISNEDKELIEKAKQAIDATKRVTKFFEEKNTVLLTENKQLKANQLELEAEVKAQRDKIEEMANEKARMSNNYIETDDVRLRYAATVRKKRKENPSDESLKLKEMDYYIDELSILAPHLTPEAIRQFVIKKEESLDVVSWGKVDYIEQANVIAKKNTDESKKASVLKAIQPKRINYNL